jgi:hypothetical protein
MIPTTTAFNMTFSRLLDVRKKGLWIEKNAPTATSARMRAAIGAERRLRTCRPALVGLNRVGP